LEAIQEDAKATRAQFAQMQDSQARLATIMERIEEKQQAASVLGKRKLCHPIFATATRCIEIATALASSNSTPAALKKATAAMAEALAAMDEDPSLKFSAHSLRKKLSAIEDLEGTIPDVLTEATQSVVKAFRTPAPNQASSSAMSSQAAGGAGSGCFTCGALDHRKAQCPKRMATLQSGQARAPYAQGGASGGGFQACGPHGAAYPTHNASNCKAMMGAQQGSNSGMWVGTPLHSLRTLPHFFPCSLTPNPSFNPMRIISLVERMNGVKGTTTSEKNATKGERHSDTGLNACTNTPPQPRDTDTKPTHTEWQHTHTSRTTRGENNANTPPHHTQTHTYIDTNAQIHVYTQANKRSRTDMEETRTETNIQTHTRANTSQSQAPPTSLINSQFTYTAYVHVRDRVLPGTTIRPTPSNPDGRPTPAAVRRVLPASGDEPVRSPGPDGTARASSPALTQAQRQHGHTHTPPHPHVHVHAHTHVPRTPPARASQLLTPRPARHAQSTFPPNTRTQQTTKYSVKNNMLPQSRGLAMTVPPALAGTALENSTPDSARTPEPRAPAPASAAAVLPPAHAAAHFPKSTTPNSAAEHARALPSAGTPTRVPEERAGMRNQSANVTRECANRECEADRFKLASETNRQVAMASSDVKNATKNNSRSGHAQAEPVQAHTRANTQTQQGDKKATHTEARTPELKIHKEEENTCTAHTPAIIFEASALWEKATPPATPAPLPLSQILAKPYTTHKKLFNPAQFTCHFCSKKGHDADFCPSRPNDKHGKDTPTEKWIDRFLERTTSSTEVSAATERLMHMNGKDHASRLTQAQAHIESTGKSLNKGNPWQQSKLARDQLRRNAGTWAALGTSRTVLSWILRGVPARFITEPPHHIFKNHPSYYEHKAFVDEEVKQHVADGSFTPIPWDRVRIVNPVQVEPKRGGKLRMCIDSRFPNAFLAPPLFHLETLEKDLPELVHPGDWLTTSDLRKAYYSLPLDDVAAPYFAFAHNGVAYAPRIIIFGESLAPFAFHKTMRETVKTMRGLGIRTMNYLDDNIFAGTKDEIQSTTKFAQFLFMQLGFRFSDKAHFTPTQVVEFLGLLVDTGKFKFFVPDDKLKTIITEIARLCRAVQTGTPIYINDLQSTLGKLNAVRAAIQPVGTWTRALHAVAAAPFAALVITQGSPAATELAFWANNISKANGHRIRETHEQIEMRTDASEMGFGGHALGIPTFGQLPLSLMGQSSTHRELFALNQVALQLENALRGKHVKVQMDSQAAVAILNKGGSRIDKQELSNLVKEWWLWCERARVTPTFEWIPRTQNTRADQLSKTFDKAWVLTALAKQVITTRWGRMRECGGEDAAAFLLGAAAQNRVRTLVTPRFTTIAYILTVAEALKLCICLVHPGWYAQPWWPRILSRASDSVALPSSRLSLAHPSASHLPDWSMFASMIDFSA